MKKFLLLLFLCPLFSLVSTAQEQEPWTPEELISTKTLADKINQEDNTLKIFSIGFDNIIKGSVDIGPGGEEENLNKLKESLKDIPKTETVIIYCGCCPFAQCPNIRPAFQLLKDLGYENPKLVDIPSNIKVDWLDKNYPVNEDL